MYLKRIYSKSVKQELQDAKGRVAAAAAGPAREKAQEELERLAMQVSHVRVLHLSKRWHPSPDLVQKGMAEGWINVAGGVLSMKTDTGDVKFRITASPDRKFGRNHFICEVI